MISRKSLFGKLGLTAYRSIESATAFCKLRGNPYVELTHWLHQILLGNDSDLHRLFRHFGIDVERALGELGEALGRLPGGATAISNFSHQIETAIERAWIFASLGYGESRIRTGHLLVALLQVPELRRETLDACPALRSIAVDVLVDSLPALLAGSGEGGEPTHDGSGLAQVLPGEASGSLPDRSNERSALDKFCADLTQQARDGAIDPVIGREAEIRTMTDILLRRRQNNPLLTGEAGVGKTAVVEGLAIDIATRKAPPTLQNVRLLALDLGALLAGASMKGEFEARLKAVIEEAGRSAVPIILFVDEVHTLVGAGGASGTGDAANLLKPALARGGLRMIGATTWSEYKKHIEKDAALTRRFQVLQVAEPGEAAAVAMVRGIAPSFETHHGVFVLDEAIRAAVSLSHRYLPARQLPDKAISLLDTACARVALSLHGEPAALQMLRRDREALRAELAINERQAKLGLSGGQSIPETSPRLVALDAEIEALEERWQAQRLAVEDILSARARRLDETGSDALPALLEFETRFAELAGDVPLVHPQVGESVVAAIVSEWTGIPVQRMVRDEIDAVLALDRHLARRVLGQDEALGRLARRVQVGRAGFADSAKPVGVFMLAGPSGVGKTETALALAEALYGGEQNLITINMSEFQEAHTVSTLKGAPPGYVGYGEGGVLTEAVRRRPYSVVLLDEVEKAHHDVHEIFLQIFDKGWMEDGEGRRIDFRNTVILLTSNAGAETLQALLADPELRPDYDALARALQAELLKVFPAAFLGRLSVLPYLPLPPGVVEDIVALQLRRVSERAQEQHDLRVDFTPAVVSHTVAACAIAESGARLLISHIEQHILPRLSRIWLDSLSSKARPARIVFDLRDGALCEDVIYDPSHRQPAPEEAPCP